MNKNYISNIFIDLTLLAYFASVILYSYTEGKSYVTKYVSILLLAGFLVSLYRDGQRIRITREWFFLAGWCVVALLSSFVAIDSSQALNRLVSVLQIYGVSFMVFWIVYSGEKLQSAWFSLVLVMLYVSFLTLTNPAVYSVSGRLVGTMSNANVFGLALLLAVIASTVVFFNSKFILFKIAMLLSAVVFVYLIYETGSRKAIIGVLIYISVVCVIYSINSVKTSVMYGLVVIMVGLMFLFVIVYFLMQSTFYDRFERLFDAADKGTLSVAGESEQGRLEFYVRGFEVALQNPALGVGLDNFRYISNNAISGGIGTYSHSNFIEVLVNTGFFGFFIYYAIYVSIAFKLYSAKKNITSNNAIMYASIFALFVVFSAYDLAMVSYSDKVSWVAMSLILAGTQLLLKNSKNINRITDDVYEPDSKASRVIYSKKSSKL